LRAPGEMCSVPWARPVSDAGVEPGPLDAGEAEPVPVDESTEERDAAGEDELEEPDGAHDPDPPARAADCACTLARAAREDRLFASLAALLALALALRLRRPRAASAR
jgi:hypothetical protein